ncbi:hypothetical protein BJX61DRAFT_539967 [Aspergillus egyptiacus]|nr:hypothetical protein BJX61DRAFT_539967 [Aspergillus egyptiacus]
MSVRTIFLVGAPTFSSLRWEENALLSESIPPFQDLNSQEAVRLLTETDTVKWRLLPAQAVPDMTQSKGPFRLMSEGQYCAAPDFVMGSGIRTIVSGDSELSQFYNHSFTVYETSEISISAALSGDSGLDSGLWTESTGTSFATNAEGEITTARPPIPGGHTNLQDIPSAEYIASIVPQTMTVSLIVAIITIRPPRRIVTRQWKRELDIIETVVGDETRTGFGVTFWLPASDDQAGTRGHGDECGEELRRSLMLLRPRDIVLLRTVGLSCFRERVYGQSLRRGLTKVDLLHRQKVDAMDTDGVYKLRDILNHAAKNEDLPLAKVRKVREWIRRFVDTVPDSAGGSCKPKRIETLPPDTQ